MRWLEAKRLDEQRKRREALAKKVKARKEKMFRPSYEDKSLPGPPEDKAEPEPEQVEEAAAEEEKEEAEEKWTLKMSPRAYEKLHPDGKHAALARKIIAAGADDPEAG